MAEDGATVGGQQGSPPLWTPRALAWCQAAGFPYPGAQNEPRGRPVCNEGMWRAKTEGQMGHKEGVQAQLPWEVTFSIALHSLP